MRQQFRRSDIDPHDRRDRTETSARTRRKYRRRINQTRFAVGQRNSCIIQRYHNKAQVRILIDDETAGSGAAMSPEFLPEKALAFSFYAIGFKRRKCSKNDFRYRERSAAMPYKQKISRRQFSDAKTVRGVKTAAETSRRIIFRRAREFKGRILIEIVKPDGTTVDVTQTILSMGVTEGEPNGIVYLQRPLWAASSGKPRPHRKRFRSGKSDQKLRRRLPTAKFRSDPTLFFA